MKKKTRDLSDTGVLLAFARLVNDLRKAQRNAAAIKSRGAAAADAREAVARLEARVDAMTLDVLGLTTPCLFDLPPEGA